MGKTVDGVFVRPVEDFKINQPAVAGQADAAGADASQRKGNLPREFAFIPESLFCFHNAPTNAFITGSVPPPAS